MKPIIEYLINNHVKTPANEILSGKYVYKNGYQDIPIHIDDETGDLFLQELGTGYNKDHFIEELTDILNKIEDNADVSFVTIIGDKRHSEIIRFVKDNGNNTYWSAEIYFSITSAEFYVFINKHIYYDEEPETIINYIVDKLNGH